MFGRGGTFGFGTEKAREHTVAEDDKDNVGDKII